MDAQRPVVEILLATYNGEKYLREQMDSILAQTDKNWRLIASDDGSDDGTCAILDEYAAAYPGRIVRHESGRRFGCARDHFFYLMRRSEAQYVFFCDQDDVWYPEKIQKTMAAMLAAEKKWGGETPVLAFTDQTPTDEALHPLAPSLMRYQNQSAQHVDYRAILMQNIVTGGAMCANRALCRLAGACSCDHDVIMHDWWLAAAAARFGQVVYLDEALSAYRQHGDNSVGAKDVGSMAYIAGKLSALGAVRDSILAKKRQAGAFADTFAARLNEEDAAFLTPFLRRRSGPLFYLKHRALIRGLFRLAGMMALG